MLKSTNTLLPYAEAYAKNRPLFMSLIRSQEAILFNNFRDYLQDPILDFGCGDGFFAKVAFSDIIIEVGLDVSDSRWREAEGKNVYKTIRVYDGDKIPYPDNSFKAVVSNCVLEHLPDLRGNVQEIERILTGNGTFLTSVMTNKWEDHMLPGSWIGNWYQQFMRTRQDHLNLLSSKEWRKVFEEAGFEVVEEVGYVSQRNAIWLDVFHYLSFPSLVTYKTMGQWVLLPQVHDLLHTPQIIRSCIDLPTNTETSAALFYVLRKKAKK